ncbi:uncharacterized protein MONBRDRAFT_26986 [Monosiga brevicollis MX1]|uniref:Uncharacterized protein n=1 Tax=Monosiga brevicollis TaxID=81824 RepID=A9V3I5_MONBE|nr:uncharacterized protein MONBRDRAFT_26986 [Monosiga brevicollis MX1]EDQ87819.1 predicted protein [Monosiga brevicollis MX1]|eukprot:XP_001747352.1 hypothetical protein [Monosiga brevicollis MX1]
MRPKDFMPSLVGPTLRFRRGDEVEIRIENRLSERVSGLHWHGIHQRFNAWVDGAIEITDCGIAAGHDARIRIRLNQTGTYWYHSHVGAQYSEGAYGALVIDPPLGELDSIATRFPYEQDYVLMLAEWFHDPGVELGRRLRSPWQAFPGFRPAYPWPPVSVLLNGKGRFNCSRIDQCPSVGGSTTPDLDGMCTYLRTPLWGDTCVSEQLTTEADQWHCRPGTWTRFRVVGAAANLPLRIWIDGHPLLVVARDGVDVQPFWVNQLTVPVGQRVDVLIHCNQTAPDFTANGFFIFASINQAFFPKPEKGRALYRELYTYGYLRYSNLTSNDLRYNNLSHLELAPPLLDPRGPHPTIDLADDDERCDDNDVLQEYDMRPLEGSKDGPEGKNGQVYTDGNISPQAPPATRRIVLRSAVLWDEQRGSPTEWWVTDNRSFVAPPRPLLHQRVFDDARELTVLPTREPAATSHGLRRETYVLDLDLGEVVEFVIVSYSGQQHPWHVHGHRVWMLGADRVAPAHSDGGPKVFADLDAFEYDGHFGQLNATTSALPGDSWTIPEYGYMVFRMRADNPGPWLLHCHVSWHMLTGMALVLDVGARQSYRGLLPPPLASDQNLCNYQGRAPHTVMTSTTTTGHTSVPSSPAASDAGVVDSLTQRSGLSATTIGSISILVLTAVGIGGALVMRYWARRPPATRYSRVRAEPTSAEPSRASSVSRL